MCIKAKIQDGDYFQPTDNSFDQFLAPFYCTFPKKTKKTGNCHAQVVLVGYGCHKNITVKPALMIYLLLPVA